MIARNDLRTQQQEHLLNEYIQLRDSGCTRFDFMGGRRSGKTYFILQQLLGFALYGDVVSVATMTDTQGRLGAYQDAKDILDGSPSIRPYFGIRENLREIYHRTTGGRIFFKSYKDSERAKGIACDHLYINEANNFTEQQYTDLAMSVRGFIFADRNPNTECWTERNDFALIHSTWKDNRANLTAAQIEEFEKLKRKAESPDATSADIALYRMYYLGEYAEITGTIFTPANIRKEKLPTTGLYNYFICADPSAMCGSDYFALCLCAVCGGVLYIVDMWSRNVGSSADAADKIAEWCSKYDVRNIFVETNGNIGQSFYEKQRSSFAGMKPYANTDNKHGRIMGNYEDICSRVVFNEDAPECAAYLGQIYEYEGKNSSKTHDDNIDCVNSAWEHAHRRYKVV